MIWVEDLDMCASTFAGVLSKPTMQKLTQSSSARLRAMRLRTGAARQQCRRSQCALASRPANYDTSRHRSLSAFDDGDAFLFGTLNPNLEKTSAKKKNRENNSITGMWAHPPTHPPTHHTQTFPHKRRCARQVFVPELETESPCRVSWFPVVSPSLFFLLFCFKFLCFAISLLK